MLRRATDLFGYNVLAQDGEIGQVHDFYFDVEEWTVRYLVVDIGFWIFGRKVLIAPDVLQAPDWERRLMPVDLTKRQVEESPELDFNTGVTRGYQESLHGHYGWPTYWGAPRATPTTGDLHTGTSLPMSGDAGGYASTQAGARGSDLPREVEIAMRESEHTHIYSINDFTGFSLEATDGSVGSVDDAFIDDADWTLRYLSIDTGTWLPGRKVLMALDWVTQVDLDKSKVYVDVTREQVEQSPEYDPHGSLGRDYEGALYNYYGYRTYW
jgi:hypothetical protein